MFRFLKRLFGGGRSDTVVSYQAATKSKGSRTSNKPKAARSDAQEEEEVDESEGMGGIDNLDQESRARSPLGGREEGLLSRIRLWVEAEKYDLPILPATNVAAMDMAANPGADLKKIVELIATDPVLSSELLKTANSVLYATQAPASTLHEAVMRIGTRGLRSLIYAVSVRALVLRTKSLETYSQEVWRQSYSVGTIARAISPRISFDPDRGFLIGLLHDLGKVVLLSMLSKASDKASDITPTIVGRVFYEYHELVGEKVSSAWKLDDELIAIAGCHHDFEANEESMRGAALASLSHRLDLGLSTGNAEEYRALKALPHFEALGVPDDVREEMLGLAREAYMALRESGEVTGPGSQAA